ncbi:MAG: hemolysin secretion protein D, partial [Proteobacteria bacterium]|nr:hemolysin secretion protein D [Pseudomonadota bacterium]
MKDDIPEFFRVIKNSLVGPLPSAATDFSEEVLESDRHTRKFGYWLLIIVFGGLGTWAIFAPLEIAARGMGTVQVEGNRKLVQHFEGGIVSEILVANGDYVIKGEPLLRLDTTQAEAERRIVEGRMWTKKALVDRLISERDDRKDILFATWLLEVTDERALVAVQNELALFKARRADRLGEIDVLEQRLSQLESRIEGTSSVVEAKESVAESLLTELVELKDLLELGYVDKQRIRQLERSRAQTLGELADLNAQIAESLVAVGEAQLNIIQIGKRFKTEVVNLLTKAQEDLYDLKQRLSAISDRVERTVIRSPTSGFVLALKPNTEGLVIGTGEDLMSIVPDVGKHVVEAKMSPMDIDRIRIGQEAEVRFAVFKDAY